MGSQVASTARRKTEENENKGRSIGGGERAGRSRSKKRS